MKREATVALLNCGDEQGTAFFLSPSVALTARHCLLPKILDPDVEISLELEGRRFIARIGKPDIPESEDVAFLEVDEPVSAQQVLPATVTHLPRGTRWDCTGYPSALGRHPTSLSGKIGNTQLFEGSWDIELLPEAGSSGALSDYSGLSGAPVIAGGQVVGIVQRQIHQTFVGISLSKLRRFLDLADIVFTAAENSGAIPPWLQAQLHNHIVNSRANWLLEEAIRKCPSRVIFMHGTPGSGKTSLAATYLGADDSIRILGRYFVSGDPAFSAHHYLDASVFANWLSAQAALHTGDASSTGSGDSLGVVISGNLQALSSYCSMRGATGIILLDGLDTDVADTTRTSLLDLLPPACPSNLSIVITGNSQALLTRLQSRFSEVESVSIPPLLQYECELLAEKFNPNLTYSEILTLIEQSEGHPLLLTLMLGDKRVGGAETAKAQFSGNLEAYYSRLFTRLSTKGSTVWLLATLARIRYSLPEAGLVKALPEGEQLQFTEAIGEVRHLLSTSRDGIRLYHDSLVTFIQSRTLNIGDAVHRRLAAFCLEYPQSDYSKINLIHHHVCAGLMDTALSLANQETFDAAGLIFGPPDLLLADLNDILDDRLSSGRLVDVIKLLLLRSRVRFRYDQLFAQSASELAELAVQLGKPERALSFVLRQNVCLCDASECAKLVRSLFISGEFDLAKRLFLFIRPSLWLAYEREDGIPSSVIAAHLEMASLLRPLSPDFEIDMKRLMNVTRSIGRQSPAHMIDSAVISGKCFGQILWALGSVPGGAIWEGEKPERFIIECATALWYSDELLRIHGIQAFLQVTGSQGDQTWNREKIAAELVARLDEHGIPEGIEAFALPVLIRYCGGARALAVEMSSRFEFESVAQLRKSNGVEADQQNLNSIFLNAQTAGFLGQMEAVPETVEVRYDWERRFIDAMTRIGRLSGERRVLSTDGQAAASVLPAIKSEILPRLCFKLADRKDWKQAYFIPETAAKLVLRQCAQVIADFDPASAEDFIDALGALTDIQFGMYSEGYVDTLALMAEALATAEESRQTALSAIILHWPSKNRP